MAKRKLLVPPRNGLSVKCCPRCYRYTYNRTRICPACEHVYYASKAERAALAAMRDGKGRTDG